MQAQNILYYSIQFGRLTHVDKSFTQFRSTQFHSSYILLAIALVVGPLLRGLPFPLEGDFSSNIKILPHH